MKILIYTFTILINVYNPVYINRAFQRIFLNEIERRLRYK